MQVIFPTEPKAKLLAVFKANGDNFHNAIEQLLQAIEDPGDSVTGDSTDSDNHQRASRNEMLGLLSSEEHNSVMRMRRIFPLKTVENCVSSLRENGGNTDQALDELMKELEERSTASFTFDAAPTPAPVVHNARVQVQRSYTPITPISFIPDTRAELRNRATIKTVCPCSVSGHKCKLEDTCGRTVVCVVNHPSSPSRGSTLTNHQAPNCRNQSCQDYHRIKSTCQACLKLDVDLHELTEHQKDCDYGHDQMEARLAIADDHLCYHH